MRKMPSMLAAGMCAIALSFGAHAASDAYKAAKKQADADYKSAKAACKPMSDTEKKDCMAKAKADHEASIERAKSLK